MVISRAVVGFGRYPEKRPTDLHVDSNGGFKLADLMSAWGEKQGYTQEDVLDAIRENMFHEGTDNGELRFSIDESPDGDITIQTTGVKKWEVKTERASWDKTTNLKVKTELGLKRPWRKSLSEASPVDAYAEGAVEWDDEQKLGEKVQRWLGYVLKRGSEDYDLNLKDGEWAQLHDLAEILAREKPDFGVSDASALRDLLETTDRAGRFEIDPDGLVRKVDRDQRQPQPPAKSDKWFQQTVAYPWQVKKEATTTASLSSAHAAKPTDMEGPPPPGDRPGKYWVMYQDHGTVWYFYDGPLGKWWCQEKYDTPEPFEEE